MHFVVKKPLKAPTFFRDICSGHLTLVWDVHFLSHLNIDFLVCYFPCMWFDCFIRHHHEQWHSVWHRSTDVVQAQQMKQTQIKLRKHDYFTANTHQKRTYIHIYTHTHTPTHTHTLTPTHTHIHTHMWMWMWMWMWTWIWIWIWIWIWSNMFIENHN